MRRFITALLVLLIFITPALAGPILPSPNGFIQSARNSPVNIVAEVDNSGAGQALSGILFLLYRAGYGIALVILFYLAIQIMIAPAQKKAEVKSALTPYILGLLLLVAGVPIATMIIEMFIQVF